LTATVTATASAQRLPKLPQSLALLIQRDMRVDRHRDLNARVGQRSPGQLAAASGCLRAGDLRAVPPDEEPRLAGCPRPDSACQHVNTYLNGSNPKKWPHQLDYFLATPSLRKRLTGCWADPGPDWMTRSDHRAIFATFDL
jgi:hypothetical protein